MSAKHTRGAVTKQTSKPIIVWFPNHVMPLLDRAVAVEDTDRSKFIRKAVRELLIQRGFTDSAETLMELAETAGGK